MIAHIDRKQLSAIFITFSGNCKKALTFYQTCFGGDLEFEVFEKELLGFSEMPIICGSLVAENIVIYGSDLAHTEGRKLGNYIAIFFKCENTFARIELLKKLNPNKNIFLEEDCYNQKLIEITDAFDVRWILSI